MGILGKEKTENAQDDIDTTAIEEDIRLGKKELLERICAASGMKRRDARPAMEATLEALGEALGAGEELNLKPLGKVKIIRTKHHDNADVFTLRLRRNKPSAKSEPSES